jgi:hypothetical protein
MRLIPLGSSAICLAPLEPGAVDVDAFADGLELGPAAVRVTNAQVQLAQYSRLQLLVTSGRVQLEFPTGASNDLVRDAASRLIAAVAVFRPTGLGFNATARLEREGDEDPVAQLFSASDAAVRLGGSPTARGGIRLIYADDTSRWTWGVDPLPDDNDWWVGTVNRHFAAVPAEPHDELLAWFSSLEGELQQRLRALMGVEEIS